MKELTRKVIVILVLVMMLINSSLLLIVSKAIDDVKGIIDETKIHPLYEIGLEKYVNYSIENDIGLLTQINLKTGIEYREDQEYKPLNSTGILLKLPQIEGEYPDSVEVIGKSTKATNGNDNAKDFEYAYDKSSGELKIVAINQQDANGNIYTEKVDNARDEYTIISYYSSKCYNDSNIERNLDFSGFVQVNINNGNKDEINKREDIKQHYLVKENILGLISTNVNTSELYNGYINSNNQNGTSYRTEYLENQEINISKKELSDSINVNISNSFIDKNNNAVDTEEIIYKSTKINKNDVMSMLGENGYLQILNKNGDLLGELNKDTEVNENGIYEIKYENEVQKKI